MRPLSVSEIVAATGGRAPRPVLPGRAGIDLSERPAGQGPGGPHDRGHTAACDDSLWITGISTDSRSLKPGEAFVALRGDRFDGHDFIPQALAAGATLVMVHDVGRIPDEAAVPFVVVSDTTRALGDLAAAYRRSLSATVVAVTGSNGKTTTKEIMYQALAGGRVAAACPAVRSVKSFNNHVGVPLTLFTVEPRHRWAVIEMGTNAPGEIRRLAEIAAPDIGVVTNVSQTHLAGLGSREGVARAKAELIASLPDDGTAVLNRDDPFCMRMARMTKAQVITFGTTPEADFFATEVQETTSGVVFRLNGRRRVRLPVVGEHNVMNALAAVAVCRRLGLDEAKIVAALERFTGQAQRLARRSVNGFAILDDTYNANPASMQAALVTCARVPCAGRRVFVCGAMAELGPASADLHRELGRRVAASDLGVLVTVSSEAAAVGQAAVSAGFSGTWRHCATTDEAADLLPTLVQAGDLVLLKGSRSVGLERVVAALEGAWGGFPAPRGKAVG